jgi:hypothetical protein
VNFGTCNQGDELGGAEGIEFFDDDLTADLHDLLFAMVV